MLTYDAPTKHERRLLLEYLCNVAALLSPTRAEARALVDWVCDHHADVLHLSEGSQPQDALGEVTEKRWRQLRDRLANARANIARARPDPVGRRLRLLGRELRLSSNDVAILELLLRYHTREPFRSMVDTVFRNRRERSAVSLVAGQTTVPDLLGISTRACFNRLQEDAPLIETGARLRGLERQ